MKFEEKIVFEKFMPRMKSSILLLDRTHYTLLTTTKRERKKERRRRRRRRQSVSLYSRSLSLGSIS
jgi:hypothetical protein